MEVIESTEGCYEVQKVNFGKVYKWCPEHVAVVCDCGKATTLTRFETACEWCGTDHADIVREELAHQEQDDETTHPWRYAEDREEAGIPF